MDGEGGLIGEHLFVDAGNLEVVVLGSAIGRDLGRGR